MMIYRYAVRVIKNYSWEMRLALFTMNTDSPSKAASETDRFIELSREMLRTSDTILSYAPGKVLILLLKVDEEKIEVPVQRVIDCWKKHSDTPIEVEIGRLENE